MPTLRIVPANIIRLSPTILMTTLSGTVKNGEGTGLPRRTVRIFSDQSLTTQVAYTYTDADGAFSVEVPTGPGALFTAVAQGEADENCVIFSKISGA